MGDGRANSGEEDPDLVVYTSAQARGHRRILVVDDDRDIADGLVEVLRDCGHEVFVARDAVEALDRIAAVHPTVAIIDIDIGLPGVSGYELAIRARGRQGSESLRLIALTGLSGAAERRDSKDAGFDVHLVKPVNLDALLEAVSAGAVPPDFGVALVPP